MVSFPINVAIIGAVLRENLSLGFSLTKFDTNQAVQPQKMARGLKIDLECYIEGLYYLFSENKGADKLCDHCAADLCFLAYRRFSHDTAH